MGYSEIRCTLCRVSFNIGRLRRIDEQEEANFLASDGYIECDANNGCWYIPKIWNTSDHGRDSKGDAGITYSANYQEISLERKKKDELEPQGSNDGDDDNDASYMYETDNEEEEYEYESDDDLVDSMMEDRLSSYENKNHESDNLYETLLKSLAPRTRPVRGTPVQIKEDGLSESERKSYRKHWEWCDHIPGPDCTAKTGYSGHRISVEQMKGCKSFQCLMKKRPNWVPIEDDEDFEIESDFFLTGLGTDMPSRDENSPRVFPARHGADEIELEDKYTYAFGTETALPFHPTCFEIYKHISRQKWGKIEIQRLMEWWYSDSHESSHPAVKACSDQWWQHHPGTEWLVANPVFVPSLSEIFKSAMSGEELDPDSGVFQPRNQPNRRVNYDPFGLLPPELSHMILSYLSSKDIAALRVVSRAYEQLPMSFFYGLIRNDMPWLWEVWSDEAPSFWTNTAKSELLAQEKARLQHEEALEHYRGVIEEEMPEMYDDWVAAEPAFETLSNVVPYDRLLRTRTNWFEVYRAITVNWKELKGLQNRKRIWDSLSKLVLSF